MSMTIICTGQSVRPAAGDYDSRGFEEAVTAELESEIQPWSGRKYDPKDNTVWIGEGQLALNTAAQIIRPCEPLITPLLNEIPLRAFTDTDRLYPAEKWKRKAAVQRRRADPRQPESRDMVIRRAEALIRTVRDQNGILITYPLFLAELLEFLRAQGFVVQRTGLLKIQPLERFLISHKNEHCGGCQHNCFLNNPGCGVGRDKAARKQKGNHET